MGLIAELLQLYKKRQQNREIEFGRKLRAEVERARSSGWSAKAIDEQLLEPAGMAGDAVGANRGTRLGYHLAGLEIGALDAREGRIKRTDQRDSSYSSGWWSEMVRLRARGWRHADLEGDFEEMREEHLKPHLAKYRRCELCGGAIGINSPLDVEYHSYPDHVGSPEQWPPRDPEIQYLLRC